MEEAFPSITGAVGKIYRENGLADSNRQGNLEGKIAV